MDPQFRHLSWLFDFLLSIGLLSRESRLDSEDNRQFSYHGLRGGFMGYCQKAEEKSTYSI